MNCSAKSSSWHAYNSRKKQTGYQKGTARKPLPPRHWPGSDREEALWYGDCADIEQKAAVLAALTVAMAVEGVAKSGAPGGERISEIFARVMRGGEAEP